MNIQQLRYVCAVAQHKLNISAAAQALYTSQPGVSKQIRLFEEELGLEVFVRQGKRLVGITTPGQQVLRIAQRMLKDTDNLKAVAEEFSNQSRGTLSIATTHTQARYTLPPVIAKFLQHFPEVKLEIHQTNPKQACEMVLAGAADFVITTEAVNEHDELISLPCHQWNRAVIAPLKHPILKTSALTLELIAQWPLITYDAAFSGRNQVNKAFLGRGLKPNIILTALDADVIKTYVGMGLGIGIIARMAYDSVMDKHLGMLDAAHLFESATTRIGIRKDAWLRGYTYAFIEFFAPHLSREMIESALSGYQGSDESI